jgi:hypothetical protein
MTEQTKEYWKLKNCIGYCVISGDNARREELEKELKIFMERVKNGQRTNKL